MRRLLLLTCLLAVLGGCLASASHGVCVPKLVSYSGKHQSKNTGKSFERLNLKADTSAAADEDDNDIEDDDHGSNFLLKRFKVITKYAVAYHGFTSVTSLRRCNLSIAAISSTRKYLAQMVLRV